MTTGPEVINEVKHAVAMIHYGSAGSFLAVRRSLDDESLPGVWGLPAASLRAHESHQDAVRRAAKQKLGVDVAVGARIGTARIERDLYTLELSDYVVEIVDGKPAVPQPDRSVSQYMALRYTADLSLLAPAAKAGSLCSRVFLDSQGFDWR